jgi:hypothetical protein
VAVRTDPAHTRAGLATAPLTRVRAGTSITLSIYTQYDLVPKGAKITVSWRVTRAGRTIFSHTVKSTRAAKQADTASAGSTPSWNHVHFTPRQPGTYVFVGSVTVNGQRQQNSITFVVKK